jgi:hypothetical protein
MLLFDVVGVPAAANFSAVASVLANVNAPVASALLATLLLAML